MPLTIKPTSAANPFGSNQSGGQFPYLPGPLPVQPPILIPPIVGQGPPQLYNPTPGPSLPPTNYVNPNPYNTLPPILPPTTPTMPVLPPTTPTMPILPPPTTGLSGSRLLGMGGLLLSISGHDESPSPPYVPPPGVGPVPPGWIMTSPGQWGPPAVSPPILPPIGFVGNSPGPQPPAPNQPPFVPPSQQPPSPPQPPFITGPEQGLWAIFPEPRQPPDDPFSSFVTPFWTPSPTGLAAASAANPFGGNPILGEGTYK